MVGEAGLEPTTPGLEGRCSIQLSYSPAGITKAKTLGEERTSRATASVSDVQERQLPENLDGDEEGRWLRRRAARG
jgi:hypothetical protein